jgi:hypothetical protein
MTADEAAADALQLEAPRIIMIPNFIPDLPGGACHSRALFVFFAHVGRGTERIAGKIG